jgi:putative transposase
MERIANCAWYSSLDLSSGYMQIPLDDDASYKCGVISEDGIYQMRRMPFGLKNATSAFSRIMNQVLYGLDEATSYVDDGLVHTRSQSFDDHLEALRHVFERFREFNLKLNPKKCVFASKTITFLGHDISQKGYSPSKVNVKVIEDFPIPKTPKEVQSFIGMASFFRKYIPNFSKMLEPLQRLTHQNEPWKWEAE